MNNLMKTISIILKLVQALLLLIGLGLVGNFTKEKHDSDTENDLPTDPYDIGQYGRYEFYLYSACIGIIIAVLGLICTICGMLEKKHGAMGLAVVQVLWVFQLLISTSLLAKVLTTYNKEGDSGSSTCETWDDSDEEYYCGQLIGGVVCGFFAVGAFALDTVISFLTFNQPEA